jgi:hypothetical protein
MKMLRSIGIAILVATSALSAFGQSWSTVKNSQQYYWGEGWGKSVAEADQQALSMLISQINVNIAVSSQQQNDRKENNGKLLSDNTTFKAAINTYSQATLDSTSIVIIEPAPKAHVGRWISKANVGKLFDSRKAKIHELVEAAERAEGLVLGTVLTKVATQSQRRNIQQSPALILDSGTYGRSFERRRDQCW